VAIPTTARNANAAPKSALKAISKANPRQPKSQIILGQFFHSLDLKPRFTGGVLINFIGGFL